jgi:hypothetical protein
MQIFKGASNYAQLTGMSTLVGLSLIADRCFGSISVLRAQEHKTGADDDSQIKPNAPVFYIPKIVGDPLLHQLQFGGLATEALDLCPTG